MTALKITRFNLDELKEVSIVCKKCGAKITYPIGKEGRIDQQCHNCGAPFARQDEYLLRNLNNLFLQIDNDRYSMEFDLTESADEK
jgi:RNase P subunit RPR2